MRRLRLLKDLLSIPAIAVLLLIVVLGNLNAIIALFPSDWDFLASLAKNQWIVQLNAWLSQNWLPNWLSGILMVLSIALFEGAYKRLSVYYWPKPTIVLSSKVETRSTQDGIVTYASLVARNQEDQEITDCYATLETATYLYGAQMTPVAGIRNNRLRWKEDQYGNGDCRITIPPKPGSRIISVSDTTNGFRFSACKPSSSGSGQLGTYLVKIRVDGKLGGKDIEPQFFAGYLYIGNVRGSQTLTMILEKGDWRKDKRIPKPKRPG